MFVVIIVGVVLVVVNVAVVNVVIVNVALQCATRWAPVATGQSNFHRREGELWIFIRSNEFPVPCTRLSPSFLDTIGIRGASSCRLHACRIIADSRHRRFLPIQLNLNWCTLEGVWSFGLQRDKSNIWREGKKITFPNDRLSRIRDNFHRERSILRDDINYITVKKTTNRSCLWLLQICTDRDYRFYFKIELQYFKWLFKFNKIIGTSYKNILPNTLTNKKQWKKKYILQILN